MHPAITTGADPPPDEVRRAARQLGEGRAIAFDVDGERFTYVVVGDTVEERPGADATTVVALPRGAWTDLTGQVRTFVNLVLSGELDFVSGGFDDLADWDPALRLLHGGVPIYDPDRVDLSAFDLSRVFQVDDADEEMRAYLDATGYLHVRGVFEPDEIDAMNAEVDRLGAQAAEGDGGSWWVETVGGASALCRLIYVTRRSEVFERLEQDDRVNRFGRLHRPDARLCTDRMEGVAALIKVPGRTEGLSNIPWHQDCGMGGHAFLCPAASIGIQLTGSSAESGHFVAVPGSHGQSLHLQWEQRLDDVPVVAIDTRPGDITVHVQDLMHASPRPTGAGGRRTVYLTFYPASLWDHIAAGQAFNDLVRDRQAETAGLGEPHA